ncbi:MAG: hypothetical protein CMK92_05200 [Pseudomonas sp.]|nr:hypothetical protein [Pseudomonas sp.]
MPMFSIGDRDYIEKLNQLAEDSTNATALKAEIEQLVADAETLLAEQQAIAATPENWLIVTSNRRLGPNEKILVDSNGVNTSIYFPTDVEPGQYWVIKALGNNVLVRPEGKTLGFPKMDVTGPDVVKLGTGEVITVVAKTTSYLEVI